MKISLFIILSSFIVIGCSSPIPEPVLVPVSNTKINYLKDVKPILDKRCVSCHSCYNSPCQAKFSSFEGVDRGASKLLVYDAVRLKAMEPTRLFIDAKSTQEWHEKEFFSLTNSHDENKSYSDSIMIQMLHDKKTNPKVVGSYKPESDKLICPKNKQEMGEYKQDKPNHGMPYGFPQIEESEYNTLTQWLKQGAKGPTKKEQLALITPSKSVLPEIIKWESFLNTQDAKHSVTARYLYEHYFLAHLNFPAEPQEFYKLVRSRTPYPQTIDTIPSVRPFDDPKVDTFYYRLQKIHSTIVHKTHMVVKFDDARFERIKKLFIDTKWKKEPYFIGYDTKSSANPFISFEQIPSKSRYQFLLNNSHYIFMTFIRGPVCRGQMALNVIHDHFWIMFKDPEFDLAVQNDDFLKQQYENLSLPIETVSQNIFKTFSDEYRNKYLNYLQAKEELYVKQYPYGQDMNSIWKGKRADDAPLLTIYRHFDSASVHKGVVGKLPRTVWVADFAQMERIYYSLVAGYDVFGNISHQTNIRRYADFLRFEGEYNFISYMPQASRHKLIKSWYLNTKLIKEKSKIYSHRTPLHYKTIYPKSEFIENVVNKHIEKSTEITFDRLNYLTEGKSLPKMPIKFTSIEDIRTGFKALTKEGTGFVKHVTDGNVNTMHLRIIMPNGKSIVGTIIINRWHDNVNSLFGEQKRLNPSKDTLDFIPYSVGSYPNSFAVIRYEELEDFFKLIQNFSASDEDIRMFRKYFIGRSDEKFWKTYDWFQEHFNTENPTQSGLYDLNRYYHK